MKDTNMDYHIYNIMVAKRRQKMTTEQKRYASTTYHGNIGIWGEMCQESNMKMKKVTVL